ncbi:MAG: purine-binding chemotaxis protein CheW [Magnetococcales bacterium]|nr:purine-binding chemotaxis protein CheW [Magnetococcales bacterium]
MTLSEWNLFDDEEEARRWVSQQMLAPSADSRQWLVCLLGDQAYGIAIHHVVQMVRCNRVTPIPQLPPFLAGLFNLEGEVIPVVDLRLRLELPAGAPGDRTILVVVRVAHPVAVGQPAPTMVGKQLGLMVDAVLDLPFIAEGEIRPPPPTTSQSGIVDERPIQLGVVRQSGREITLLDVDVLLSREEMLAAIAGSTVTGLFHA